MATIKEMREQAAKTVADARALNDEITADTSAERAAEIEASVDAALASAADIEAKIERQEKLDAATRKIEEARELEERSRRPGGEAIIIPGADAGEAPSYRQAFHAYLRNAGELGMLSPEERGVLSGGFAKVEARAQVAGTASAGGYTVPEEMLPELVRSMKAFGPMYDGNVCREIVTSGGNPMPFPTIDDTASTAEAHTEGATLTDDGGKDATFGEKQLDAFAFNTEWVRVSKELADDSFLAMEALLGSLLGERLGRIANAQLTTGTGSSAPNGIVSASAAGKVAASASAITYDEILDLEHSVDPAYRSAPGVGYMLNDAMLLAVRKLKDGDGNYLWQAGNVQGGIPNTINGRGYVINQDMAGFGVDNRVMLFGDFQKYFVRKVGQPLIGAISDKDFWPGFGVAGYIRFDGELSDAAAVKHLACAAA